MQLGEWYIDFNQLILFFESRTALQLIWDLFVIAGWMPFAYMLLYLLVHFWEEYKEDKAKHHWKWVLLAIDVPALNIQTPKAVEQLFSHLAGAYDSPNIAEKFREGFKQRWFSFEIISIEGYIQFLIRTEESFRDLVEAAVYAQYPEAEVTEVEDYTENLPTSFPNSTHDIWAADFTLTEHDAYPIRTYRDFEHTISKDTAFKDPMGTLLESFSRLGPGEQMWFQIIIEPTSSHWKEKAIKKIKEVIGEKESHHGHPILDAILSAPIKFLVAFGDYLFGREKSEEEHGDDGPKNELQFMTPGQTKIVEAMENKITKIGFKTKMRGVYIARKEVFRPVRGVNALKGAITQFNVPSANSLAPTFGVGASYLWKKQRIAHRKTLMMEAYKKRKLKAGANPFILNIEELATVWHFPMSHVKTPLLQKASVKTSEPPAGLPVEQIITEGNIETPAVDTRHYQTDAGDVGYDSPERFG